MTPVHAIIAKELRSCFVSPVVYVVGAVFLLIFGILSYLAVVNVGARAVQLMQLQGAAAQINLNDMVFRPTFYSTAVVLLLVLPILTMRLFAEERKLRTFELLLTSPIRINEVVVGKFLSVYLIFLGLLALTGLVPLILSLYSSFDWKPVLTGYLGLALMGALFLAAGVFTSTLTENQIVAAVVSLGLFLLLWMIDSLAYLLPYPSDTILSNFSLLRHFTPFATGALYLSDVGFFISVILAGLFLSVRALARR